jgi:hypothetical protein
MVCNVPNDQGILHLVHPRPVAWLALFTTFSKLLGVPVVPSSQWIRLLEQQQQSVLASKSIPALKILDFLKETLGAGEEANYERLDTTHAQQTSKTLRNMAPLAASDAQSWVSYWKTAGFM